MANSSFPAAHQLTGKTIPIRPRSRLLARTRFFPSSPAWALASVLLVLLLLPTGAASALGAASVAHSTAKHHALFPVTIRDDTGYKVTIPKRPRRIVSLDPRDTETLFSLNLERRIVADGGSQVEGAFCCRTKFKYPSQWPSPWGRDYPSRARRLPHIEGGYDSAHPFDIEAVEKKHPNLVVSLNSDPEGIQKMRSVGLKVVVLDPHTLLQIQNDIRLVGRITGQVKQAKVVVGNIRSRLKKVERALASIHKLPRVFYEIDDSTGTPYTACHGSFIDQMLTVAKAKNIAHNVQPCPKADPYPQMSSEAVVHDNPQDILLGDSNYGTTPAQVKSRPGWNVIDAVKHNRIFPVDDDLVSRAGPREVIGLERVARLLHPRAFR